MTEQASSHPPELFRGITVPSSSLNAAHLVGDLSAGSRVEQPDGSFTVADGNEYGVYMSTNQAMVTAAYANPRHGRQIPGLERLTYGIQRIPVQEPSVGILYRIDPQGLPLRRPQIKSSLMGVYNNGFVGDEWIADFVPAAHVKVPEVKLGADALHKELLIRPERGDVEPLVQEIREEAARRVEKLKLFGNALLEMTPAQRLNSTRIDRLIEETRNKNKK